MCDKNDETLRVSLITARQIKKALKLKKISQTDLAEQVYVCPRHIRRLLCNGISNIDLIFDILNVLDMKFEELLAL